MKPVVIQWVCRSVCAHLFLINRWRNRNLKIWMKTKITKRNKATAFVRILCIVGRSASTEKRSLSNQITIRNMALRIKSKKYHNSLIYVEKKKTLYGERWSLFCWHRFSISLQSSATYRRLWRTTHICRHLYALPQPARHEKGRTNSPKKKKKRRWRMCLCLACMSYFFISYIDSVWLVSFRCVIWLGFRFISVRLPRQSVRARSILFYPFSHSLLGTSWRWFSVRRGGGFKYIYSYSWGVSCELIGFE